MRTKTIFTMENNEKRVFNIYGGNYIETQNNYISGGNVYFGEKAEATEEAAADPANEAVRQLLLPIFKGNAARVDSFLLAIANANPRNITAMVKQYAADGIINPLDRYKPLWKILHDNGLYPHTSDNWNKQV